MPDSSYCFTHFRDEPEAPAEPEAPGEAPAEPEAPAEAPEALAS